LDETDRKILNLIQEDIPIVEQPFAEIGRRIGLSEAETLKRIQDLKERDMFRRIGPSFAPRKLGYTTTLVAARIPPDKLEPAVEFINRYAEITHNYERSDHFNVWFTIIANGQADVKKILDEIMENTGAEEILDLPASHIFKLQVQFDVEEK